MSLRNDCFSCQVEQKYIYKLLFLNLLQIKMAIRLTLPNSSCGAHSSDEGFCEM